MDIEQVNPKDRKHVDFLTEGVQDVLLGAWDTDGTGVGSVVGDGMVTVLVSRHHRLAGFFTIDGRMPPHHPECPAWQLEHAYLAPRFRGRGLSGELCEAMLEWASPFGLFFRAPVAPVLRHHAQRLGILLGDDLPDGDHVLIPDCPDEVVDSFAVVGCKHASRTCADCAREVTATMARDLVAEHLGLPTAPSRRGALLGKVSGLTRELRELV